MPLPYYNYWPFAARLQGGRSDPVQTLEVLDSDACACNGTLILANASSNRLKYKQIYLEFLGRENCIDHRYFRAGWRLSS